MENTDFQLISAEQARLIAEPKEKTLKDIMWSIEYWAKKGDTKLGISTKEYYLSPYTWKTLLDLGYAIAPANELYPYIDISWKQKS